MPFCKKFPELVETTRLRILECIADHFETMTARLNRQSFRWGSDYITAFVRQYERIITELEVADCHEMVATEGGGGTIKSSITTATSPTQALQLDGY